MFWKLVSFGVGMSPFFFWVFHGVSIEIFKDVDSQVDRLQVCIPNARAVLYRKNMLDENHWMF